MKIPRVKGTRDWSPEEMTAFRFIEGKFREQCRKWGYHEVRTPTIESMHLFTSAGTLTPGMLNRVYSFLDWDGWSGERVVLRPDGTIPIVRFYIDRMNNGSLAKLCYITNIFIFEETGKESRERWQCGAELIGAPSPLADAELISLALKISGEIGIRDISIRLSHAGLIKSLLGGIGLSKEEQDAFFDRILDGDVATLTELKTKNSAVADLLPSLLKLKGQSAGFLNNLKAVTNIGEIREHFENFMAIVNLLESLDLDYEIDIASGAGFEYYTGVIFQLYTGGRKIGGGGRYDDLVPGMGGNDAPACGFALYIDRLMSLVNLEKAEITYPEIILVSIRPGEDVTLDRLFKAQEDLHRAGYIAEIEMAEKRPVEVRWLLELGGKAPLFTLTDLSGGTRLEAGDISGVQKILEAKSGRQNRPA